MGQTRVERSASGLPAARCFLGRDRLTARLGLGHGLLREASDEPGAGGCGLFVGVVATEGDERADLAPTRHLARVVTQKSTASAPSPNGGRAVRALDLAQWCPCGRVPTLRQTLT